MQLKPFVTLMENLRYVNGFVKLCSLTSLPWLVSRFDKIRKIQMAVWESENKIRMTLNMLLCLWLNCGLKFTECGKYCIFRKGILPQRAQTVVPPAHFAFAESTEVAPVLILQDVLVRKTLGSSRSLEQQVLDRTSVQSLDIACMGEPLSCRRNNVGIGHHSLFPHRFVILFALEKLAKEEVWGISILDNSLVFLFIKFDPSSILDLFYSLSYALKTIRIVKFYL